MMKRLPLPAYILSLAMFAGCAAVPEPTLTDIAVIPATTGDEGQDITTPGAGEDPSTYGHFLVGRFAALTNDPREAAQQYEAAINASPALSELTERAIFAALLANDFEQAITLARSTDQQTVREGSLTPLTLAVGALRDGNVEAARSFLSAGNFGPFNHMVARNLLGWASIETEGIEAAKRYLIDGRTNDALLDGVTLNMVGLLQVAAGNDGPALATFEAVWDAGAHLAVATDTHARLLVAEGRSDEALTLLSEFRSEIGLNPVIEALRRDIEAGRPVPVKRYTMAEGAAQAIYGPAAALAAQTDTDLSGVYFALVLALNPDMDAARSLWGHGLDQVGRRGDAIAILEQVDVSSPFYATARGQLAWALRREGRNQEALDVAAQALAASPDRDLQVQLGDLLGSLDRHGESAQVLSRVIADDRAAGRVDWRLLYARGAAYEQLGRWPDAETDLVEALALAPNEASVLNYLGYNWIDRGLNTEKALAMVERAARLQPTSGFIIDSLGWAHFKLGNYKRAATLLERAVELEPADPVLNDHLGDAYWQIGRKTEARFQWSRALAQAPTERDRRLILAKLEKGLDMAMAEAETLRLAARAPTP